MDYLVLVTSANYFSGCVLILAPLVCVCVMCVVCLCIQAAIESVAFHEDNVLFDGYIALI